MSLIVEEKKNKICSKCKKEKFLECFGPHNKTKDKKNSWCRDCNKLYMQERRKSNPELERFKTREYYKNNIDKERKRSKEWRKNHNEIIINYFESPKGRFSAAKASAKNRKLVWAISFDDYIKLISKLCYYCGDKLNSRGIGLDRIDSNSLIGYILSNVVPCCGTCNYMKQESMMQEFKDQIIKIVKNLRLL